MKFCKNLKSTIQNHNLSSDILGLFLYGCGFATKYSAGEISQNKAYHWMHNRYFEYIKKHPYESAMDTSVMNKTIWCYWHQGFDSAPEMVKLCLSSIQKAMPDWKMCVLDKKSLKNYVKLPEFILKKLDKGKITLAHFSDIVRLALLEEHGGLWCDATVFLTRDPLIDFSKTDLFCFHSGYQDMETIRAQLWFLYARPHNPIIGTTLKILYKYWSDKSFLKHYFLINLAFSMALEIYPQEWMKVLNINAANSYILSTLLFSPFNSNQFSLLSNYVGVHKLSTKKLQENLKGTYYEHLKELEESNQ